MLATTGERPHAYVAEGACCSGTVTKVQPPFPGYLNIVEVNSTS